VGSKKVYQLLAHFTFSAERRGFDASLVVCVFMGVLWVEHRNNFTSEENGLRLCRESGDVDQYVIISCYVMCFMLGYAFKYHDKLRNAVIVIYLPNLVIYLFIFS
jgi:hypothetical protein